MGFEEGRASARMKPTASEDPKCRRAGGPALGRKTSRFKCLGSCFLVWRLFLEIEREAAVDEARRTKLLYRRPPYHVFPAEQIFH